MNPLMTTGLDDAHRGATALSVNLNLVAMMRNRRALDIPSVARAATIVLEAGAAGITVHPRPDERHIRRGDVADLAALLKDWPQAEFNIEGNPFHNLMDHVRATRPAQCTFVPDAEGQSTSDHGWDLAREGSLLAPLIAEARALGVRVSLFMDAEPGDGAREIGFQRTFPLRLQLRKRLPATALLYDNPEKTRAPVRLVERRKPRRHRVVGGRIRLPDALRQHQPAAGLLRIDVQKLRDPAGKRLQRGRVARRIQHGVIVNRHRPVQRAQNRFGRLRQTRRLGRGDGGFLRRLRLRFSHEPNGRHRDPDQERDDDQQERIDGARAARIFPVHIQCPLCG